MNANIHTLAAWLFTLPVRFRFLRPVAFLYEPARHPKDPNMAKGPTLVIFIVLGALDAMPLGPKQCLYTFYLARLYLRFARGQSLI